MKNDQNPDPAPGADKIIGFKAIRERVAARAGLPISQDAVVRCAKRAVDPLPARKWGARVFAVAADLDAWSDRQFKDVAPASSRSSLRSRRE